MISKFIPAFVALLFAGPSVFPFGSEKASAINNVCNPNTEMNVKSVKTNVTGTNFLIHKYLKNNTKGIFSHNIYQKSKKGDVFVGRIDFNYVNISIPNSNQPRAINVNVCFDKNVKINKLPFVLSLKSNDSNAIKYEFSLEKNFANTFESPNKDLTITYFKGKK
jgi:hypothetical protein